MKHTIKAGIQPLTNAERNRVTIVHCSQVVEMGEAPTSALRNKKDSSMRRVIELVESGEANACVSAGNTGALLSDHSICLKPYQVLIDQHSLI